MRSLLMNTEAGDGRPGATPSRLGAQDLLDGLLAGPSNSWGLEDCTSGEQEHH